MEAESLVQKFMRTGYIDTKGKTQQQVKQELETRFGSLAKKGVKVHFYGEKDIDTSSMDESTKAKLAADGFAVTKDGTVWINKEHVDSGKLIDFNTLTQHEISHIVFGDDSEYQAQYVEKAYGEFLKGVQDSGYAQDGQGIIDYRMSMLVDEDWLRLNGYTNEDMQFKELTGGDGDRFTVINLKYQSISTAMRNAALSDKYTKARDNMKASRERMGKLANETNKKRRDRKTKAEIEKEVDEAVTFEYKKRHKEIDEEQKDVKKRGLVKREEKMFKILKGKDVDVIKGYFDLNVNQRDNVITSVDVQREAHRKSEGRYPGDNYTKGKLAFFISNPEGKGTVIVTRIPAEVLIKLAQTEIYPDGRAYPTPNNKATLWNFTNSEEYTKKGVRDYTMLYKDSKTGLDKEYTFRVLDKRETSSGLQIMAVWDPKTRETVVIGQGSYPGIGYPAEIPYKSYGKVALGETVNSMVRSMPVLSLPFLSPLRDTIISESNKRTQSARDDVKNYKMKMKGWAKDWIDNNFIGNINPRIMPNQSIVQQIRNIVDIASGRKAPFTPDQSTETEQYIRELNSGKIIDNRKYGYVSLGVGHSLEGQGITYGTDRTGINSIVIDPAPNNLKINNQRSHLTLLSDSAILNRSEVKNGIREYFTSFYGFTTSVGIGSERYGMGTGARGVPVFRSRHHYTGDPVRKTVDDDGHKMSEHFDRTRQEIETIDNLLVRPEGWDR